VGEGLSPADPDASGEALPLPLGETLGSTLPLGAGATDGVGSGRSEDGMPSASSTNRLRKIAITTSTQPRASQSFRGGSAPR
jgi:hypothetical protein